MSEMNKLMTDLGSASLLVVWLGLIVVALVQWRRHPPAALMVVIALILLLVTHVLNLYMQKQMYGSNGVQVSQLSSQLLYIAVRFVQILTYVMLVWAVFTGRSKRAPD